MVTVPGNGPPDALPNKLMVLPRVIFELEKELTLACTSCSPVPAAAS